MSQPPPPPSYPPPGGPPPPPPGGGYPPPPGGPPPSYPPPGSPPPYAGPPAGAPAGGHPLQFHVDPLPERIERWRAFQFILAIPQLVVADLLGRLAGLLNFIAAIIVIFTKKIPEGLFNFIVMAWRYEARAHTYAAMLRTPYPPFTFDVVPIDPGGDPTRLSLPQQAEYNRWAPLYKWIILIPWVIVGFFYAIAAFVVLVIGFFSVLFTGKWSAGMRDFVVKVMRYWYRVQSHFVLSDVRPGFSLQ